MKKFNHLELCIIKAALLLDQYTFNYYQDIYTENIGTYEICRDRHVNDLVDAISNNSADLNDILRTLSNDVEYISFQVKENAKTINLDQLNDAYEILAILEEIC